VPALTVIASPDARLLWRPFAGYRELVAEEPPRWSAAAWGGARWLLFVGCFVAWTTSGRLVADHLIFAPLSWAFGPVLQGVWIALAARASKVERPTPQVVALYFRGHAPWMLVLLAVSGFCLFVPEPGELLVAALGVVAVAMALAMVWCAFLTYALFRGAFDLDWRQSLRAAGIFYLGYSLSLVAWYGVTGQLAPILGWVA
jgi:hypothetical protein